MYKPCLTRDGSPASNAAEATGNPSGEIATSERPLLPNDCVSEIGIANRVTSCGTAGGPLQIQTLITLTALAATAAATGGTTRCHHTGRDSMAAVLAPGCNGAVNAKRI